MEKHLVSISSPVEQKQLSKWKKSRSSRLEVFFKKCFFLKKLCEIHRKAPALESLNTGDTGVTGLKCFHVNYKARCNTDFIVPDLIDFFGDD